MPATVNLHPLALARYLTVALKQKERAVNKFVQDYGPNSATVQEITGEVAQLRQTINKLEAPDQEAQLELIKGATKK